MHNVLASRRIGYQRRYANELAKLDIFAVRSQLHCYYYYQRSHYANELNEHIGQVDGAWRGDSIGTYHLYALALRRAGKQRRYANEISLPLIAEKGPDVQVVIAGQVRPPPPMLSLMG